MTGNFALFKTKMLKAFLKWGEIKKLMLLHGKCFKTLITKSQ